MRRLLVLGIYAVLIAAFLVVGVASAADSASSAVDTSGQTYSTSSSLSAFDIVPAKQVFKYKIKYCVIQDVDNRNTLEGCLQIIKKYLHATVSQPSNFSVVSDPSAELSAAWSAVYMPSEMVYLTKVSYRSNDGFVYSKDFYIVGEPVSFYECPPDDNPEYILYTSKPDEPDSAGKYCTKPEENKCKKQTLSNPLDEDGLNLYYYKSSLSGCFDGCKMTFKSDPDAEATYNAGGSVLNGLLASCGYRCTGPLMQYDGTQCEGSDIQTTPEPTTSGAEPTTSGAEPTTSGAEPTTSGAEPTTSGAEPTTSGAEPTTSGAEPTTSGAEPTTSGAEHTTSGGTGTGGGSGSGAGTGSGSGSGGGTGTSGGTGTGAGSPTDGAVDFCKLHPSSIACSELGSVDAEKISTDEINVSVDRDSGWGADSAQCPASPKIGLEDFPGGSITLNNRPLCDLLAMLRPVIVSLAWLIAAFIMIGWRTSSAED